MDNSLIRRNNSIDIFRYFCALLIVAIHVHPLAQFGKTANSVSIDYFTRIGVPFFFITAGYFYSKKLLSGKKPLKKYILNILPVYIFWSVFYAVALTIKDISEKNFGVNTFICIVKGFLYKGVSEHLWFIPSLIVAICVLTLFHKIKATKLLYVISIILFVIACLGFTYRDIAGSKIPILSSLYLNNEVFTQFHRLGIFGVTFVTLGCFIFEFEKLLTKGRNLFYITACGVLFPAFIAEKIMADKYNFGGNHLYSLLLYPLMLFIFLTLLKNPLYGLEKEARYLRNASSFTYFSHPIFITVFAELISRTKLSLFIYVAVCAVTLLLSLYITKLNNKKLNFLNA